MSSGKLKKTRVLVFFLFTIIILSIRTPLLIMLVLKFEIVHSTTFDVSKMAKCVGPDVDHILQIRRHNLLCLIWVYTVCKGLFVPILRVITVSTKLIFLISPQKYVVGTH